MDRSQWYMVVLARWGGEGGGGSEGVSAVGGGAGREGH